jgi:aminoglycoside phosphotransferase (APT) family kinase protein
VQISLADLQASLQARLAAATGRSVVVHGVEPLGGGACQDNYRVDLDLGDGLGLRAMALRSDAKKSLAGSIDRREEFAVIGAAVAAGVKTPAAHFLMEGLLRPGASAYLLDWADGVAIGRRVLRDADLAPARKGLAAEVAVHLARIHSVTPAAHPGLLPPAPERDLLRSPRRMLASLREPRPALAIALRWLEQNPPQGTETVLVHGDFRTGNFMVTPGGLAGVLDWEFAHWGSPAEDLAWIQMRTWRFNSNKLPVGGFGRRADFYAAYEEASGRAVNRRDVHHYEVLGNVRWAAGCVQQGERYLSGEEQDLELIAIPRRAVEMEYEALRLIEKGPA